jgi:NAD(P)H-flavin reductase
MRGPLGRRWPLEEAAGDDLLLIGGGMGLAAWRPIVYAVMKDRPRFGRLTILCGARTPADLIYTPELAAWDRLSRTDVLTTVDAAGPTWLGYVGVVTALLDKVALRPANTTAMICGPDAMMRSTARDLNSRGLSDRRIFSFDGDPARRRADLRVFGSAQLRRAMRAQGQLAREGRVDMLLGRNEAVRALRFLRFKLTVAGPPRPFR